MDFIIKLLYITLFIVTLTSCGGGGDSTPASSTLVNEKSALQLNTGTTGSVIEGNSNYHKFSVKKGITYTIDLRTLAGDADLAVRNKTPTPDLNNIIVYSVDGNGQNNPHNDVVIFTALYDGIYFVEINGFVNSEYSVIARVNQDNIGFDLSRNLINFINIEPNYSDTDAEVTVFNRGSPLDLINIDIVGDSSDWLRTSTTPEQQTVNGKFKKIYINIDTDLIRRATETTRASILLTPKISDPSIHVFKIIDVVARTIDSNIPQVISATDNINAQLIIEGDYEFDLSYGPLNFEVSEDGQIKYRNIIPLLSELTEVNFGISVKSENFSGIAHGALVIDSNGSGGLLTRSDMPISEYYKTGNLDEDANVEILSGSKDNLFIAEYANGTFIQEWVYPSEIITDHDIALADMIKVDNADEIIVILNKGVATDNHKLVRLNPDKSIKDITEINLRRFYDYISHDIDLDGTEELIFMQRGQFSQESLAIIDVKSGELLWESESDDYGWQIKVGNFQIDSDIEIVSINGYLFDIPTNTISTISMDPFYRFETNDFNNDGLDDILYQTSNTDVSIHFTHDNSVETTSTSHTSIGDIFIGNLDNDTEDEILLLGSSEYHTYNYNQATKKLDIDNSITPFNNNLEHTFLHDINNDNINEIFVIEGIETNQDEFITVFANYPDMDTLSSSTDLINLRKPFYSGALASIDGSETAPIYIASDSSGNDFGSRIIKWSNASSPIDISQDSIDKFTSDHYLVFDYDNDNIDEILVYDHFTGTSDYSLNAFELDMLTIEQSFTLSSDFGSIVDMTAIDVNNDNRKDVIAFRSRSTFVAGTFVNERYLWIYDTYNNSLISNTRLDENIYKILTKIVANNDTNNEVSISMLLSSSGPKSDSAISKITINSQGQITSELLKTVSEFNLEIRDIASNDTDNNGTTNTLMLLHNHIKNESELQIFDENLELLKSSKYPDKNFYSIQHERLGEIQKNIYLVESLYSNYRTTDASLIWSVDPNTGSKIWVSPPILGRVEDNSIHFVDPVDSIMNQLLFSTSTAFYKSKIN